MYCLIYKELEFCKKKFNSPKGKRSKAVQFSQKRIQMTQIEKKKSSTSLVKEVQNRTIHRY